MKCVMGVVATIIRTFPGIWALPEHVFPSNMKNKVLLRSLPLLNLWDFSFNTKLPEAVVTLTDNAASGG